MKQIEDIPAEDRPRAKIASLGVGALSDMELLAAVLGAGNRKNPVMKQAQNILKCFDENGLQPELADLKKIDGVGPARAMLLCSAMEFARRRIRPAGFKIRDPRDLLPLVRHYADRQQEHLLCVTLNGADEIITTRVVTVGLVNQSQIHPREVFAGPITDRAVAIVLAHNHPSGSVQPSRQDVQATDRMVRAGNLLGIEVKDHLVFSHQEYFSFIEHNMIK